MFRCMKEMLPTYTPTYTHFICLFTFLLFWVTLFYTIKPSHMSNKRIKWIFLWFRFINSSNRYESVTIYADVRLFTHVNTMFTMTRFKCVFFSPFSWRCFPVSHHQLHQQLHRAFQAVPHLRAVHDLPLRTVQQLQTWHQRVRAHAQSHSYRQ